VIPDTLVVDPDNIAHIRPFAILFHGGSLFDWLRRSSRNADLTRAGATAQICERLSTSSPELNPVESFWHYLRENILCSLVWNIYDDAVKACSIARRFLTDDPQRIRSIGNRKWACVSP